MHITLLKGESLTVRFTETETRDGAPDIDGEFTIEHDDTGNISISTTWPDDQGRGTEADPVVYFVSSGYPEEGQMQSVAVGPKTPLPGVHFTSLYKGEPTTACSMCGKPQTLTRSGLTCADGHGGADPLALGEKPTMKRPRNCRIAQEERGEPYPRSGCDHCDMGGLTGCPFAYRPHDRDVLREGPGR